MKWYVAPDQYPVSGLIETSKAVKSFGFGKLIVATLPPSSSPISLMETGANHFCEMSIFFKKKL